MLKRSSKDVDLKSTAAAKLPEELVVRAILRDAIAKAEASLPNPAAVALGRRGGLKGGKARAASLSAARRAEIAKKAAAARWDKTRNRT
jgi:hypothetical protein